jgi:hypothetical protein
MSFEIGPEARKAAAAPPADRAGSEPFPADPPPEVREAMGVAARAYQDLQDAGRELRFKVDAATDRLRIEVHDARGNLLYTVPPSKVLDIAGGDRLP